LVIAVAGRPRKRVDCHKWFATGERDVFGDAPEEQCPQAFGRILQEAPTFHFEALFDSGVAILKRRITCAKSYS
jgi:hypothetical protein